jgi:hypothetical protein
MRAHERGTRSLPRVPLCDTLGSRWQRQSLEFFHAVTPPTIPLGAPMNRSSISSRKRLHPRRETRLSSRKRLPSRRETRLSRRKRLPSRRETRLSSRKRLPSARTGGFPRCDRRCSRCDRRCSRCDRRCSRCDRRYSRQNRPDWRDREGRALGERPKTLDRLVEWLCKQRPRADRDGFGSRKQPPPRDQELCAVDRVVFNADRELHNASHELHNASHELHNASR